MSKWFSILLVALMAISLTACGGGKTCDSGTVASGGKCVPACADGETWDGTQCVAGIECAAGTHLDNGQCVSDITGCAAGTELVNGQCVPECGEGEYYNVANDACEPIPECGTGTSWNEATAQCEPDVVCAVGTHDEGGECVPDVVCGADTHPENGECVPNVLPDPDVPEAAEPNDILYGGVEAQFELAAEGEMVSLGGTVGTPTDLDDDGIADADWDSFVFAANAGTYLEIHATSEGATLPAFAVWGVDADGYIVYDRWAMNPNGIDSVRRVYLPIDGVYIIQVSDYSNALAHPFGFGMDTIPTGGDEFTYYMTVESLPAPAITDVDTIPNMLEGDFDSLDVAGYNLVGLSNNDLVELFAPGQPLADTPNDVIVSLMMFDNAGNYMGSVNADSVDGDAATWLPAHADGDYLVFVDYWVILGGARQYGMAVDFQPVVDCTVDDCTDVDLAEGDMTMIGFDLLAYDLFAATVFSDVDNDFDPVVYLLDNDLAELDFSDDLYSSATNESVFAITAEDQRLYLLVMNYFGLAATFNFETVIGPTEEIVAGTEYTGAAFGLTTDHKMGAAVGANHFATPTAGQIAYFVPTTNDGTWGETWALAILDGINNNAVEERGDGLYWTADPIFPVVSDGAEYIYRIMDVAQSPSVTAGSEYTTTLHFLDPVDAGAPTMGTPVDLLAQDVDAVSGVGFFQFTAEADMAYIIDVTPTVSSEIALEGQIFENFYIDADGYIMPDPTGHLFIRWDADTTSGAAGEAISFGYVPGMGATYAGTYTIMLANTNAAAADTTFDIHIEPMLCLPGGSQCNGDVIELCPDGDAWVTDVTCINGCELDENGAAFCTPQCDPGTYVNECDGNGDLQFCDATGFYAIDECRIGCEVVADGADICTPECDAANDVPVCNADSNVETCVDDYWVVTECLAGCDDSGGDAVCIVPGDTCAEAINLDGLLPFSSFVDSTDNTDDNGSTDTDCTGYSVAGHDIYWAVTLAEGDTVAASMNPNPYFDAAIYMYAGGCPGTGSCVIGDDSGNPEEFVYTVPAGAGGVYYIVTDGYGGSGYGTFDFTVDVY